MFAPSVCYVLARSVTLEVGDFGYLPLRHRESLEGDLQDFIHGIHEAYAHRFEDIWRDVLEVLLIVLR